MQRPYDKNVMFEKQRKQNGWNESSSRLGAKVGLMVWKGCFLAWPPGSMNYSLAEMGKTTGKAQR